MSREVWFQLVDKEGKAITKAYRVKDLPDDAKVVDFQDEVIKKCPNNLANVDASDLTVYENRLKFDTKQGSLEEDSLIGSFGGSKKDALVVQVKYRAASVPTYFILPETREKIAKAVFIVVDEDSDCAGVGMGVFFSLTLAVTCDHNLTDEHTVGSVVLLALKDGIVNVEVAVRNAELDFAILKSSEPRSFILPWSGRPDELESRYDLVLASFRLGVDEYQSSFRGKLGFAPAACITISSHERHIMYSCPTYAGDSGAALLVRDGYLVGIHLETINALREDLDRKKLTKDRLNAVEESLENIVRSGLAHGCTGLLVHQFKDVVSE